MSAEAVRTFQRHSKAKGMARFVLHALAHFSKHRIAPFWSNASFTDVATFCGITTRGARKIIRQLIEAGEIEVLKTGGGRTMNLYDLHLESREPLNLSDGNYVPPSIRRERNLHSPARGSSEETDPFEAIDAEYGGRRPNHHELDLPDEAPIDVHPPDERVSAKR